jgi:DNA-directed RNA polymerase omega subunit
MIYPKIEDCVSAVACKYTLAIMVAKRAKELTMKMPAEFASSNTKEITYALNEVVTKKLAPVAAG